MVKNRIFWIITLVAILIALCVTEEIYVNNIINEMKTKINTFETSAKLDAESTISEDTQASFEDMMDYWTTHENTICLFVNHNNMKELGYHLVLTKHYIENGDKDELYEQIEVIKYYINSYGHTISASFQNIL